MLQELGKKQAQLTAQHIMDEEMCIKVIPLILNQPDIMDKETCYQNYSPHLKPA